MGMGMVDMCLCAFIRVVDRGTVERLEWRALGVLTVVCSAGNVVCVCVCVCGRAGKQVDMTGKIYNYKRYVDMCMYIRERGRYCIY